MARKPNPPELERTMIHEADLFTDLDIYLFKEGNHFELYKKLGSHLETVEGVPGARFAVWAPNAVQVSVIGDFNGWNGQAHPLSNKYHEVGIWEGFIPGLRRGERYKYLITPRHGQPMEKGDPYAFHWEVPPRSASVVWDLEYEWGDREWMENQPRANALDRPVLGLRGAPGLLATGAGGGCPSPHLPRAGAPAGRLCPRDGLHPCRVHAGDGASLLWFLGLPGAGLFRPLQPVRHPPGLHVPDRLPSPAGDRGAAGLGALALSPRPARAGAFRWHLPVRARWIPRKASTRSGRATSSTTAATRCAIS